MNPQTQHLSSHCSLPLTTPNKLQRSSSLSNTMRYTDAKHNQPQFVVPLSLNMIPQISNNKKLESLRFIHQNTLPPRQNTPIQQQPFQSQILFSPSVVSSTNKHNMPPTSSITTLQVPIRQESSQVPACIGMKSASPVRLGLSNSSSNIAVGNTNCISQSNFKDTKDISISQVPLEMSASSIHSVQSSQRNNGINKKLMNLAYEYQPQKLSQQLQSQSTNNNNTIPAPSLSSLNPNQFQSASVRALMDTFQKHKDLIQKQSRSSSSYSSSSQSSSSTPTQLSDRRLSFRNDIPNTNSAVSLQSLTSIPPGCCALAKISSRQVISPEEKLKIASFAKKVSIEGEGQDTQIITQNQADDCVLLANETVLSELCTLREQEEQQKELSCFKITLNNKNNITTNSNNSEILLKLTNRDEGKLSKRSTGDSSRINIKQEEFSLRQPSSYLENLLDIQEDKISTSKITQEASDTQRENQQTQIDLIDPTQQQQQYESVSVSQEPSQSLGVTVAIKDNQEEYDPSIQTEIIPQDQQINYLFQQHPSDTNIQQFDCQYYDMDIRTNTDEYCIAEQTNTDRDLIEEKESKQYLSQIQQPLIIDSNNNQIMITQEEEPLAERYSNQYDYKIEEQTEEESIVSNDQYITLSPCLKDKQQQQLQTPLQIQPYQEEQQAQDIDILSHPSSSSHSQADSNINIQDNELLFDQSSTKEKEQSSMLSSDSTPVTTDRINPKNCKDASTSPIKTILSPPTTNNNNTIHMNNMQFSSEDSSNLLIESDILTNGQSQLNQQEEQLKLEEEYYQSRKRQIQGEIKTMQRHQKQQHHLTLNTKKITIFPCSSSNTSNSNSCTAASSKGDTFTITDASISQSMQMIAMQKREEILDRIKHIDAQLLVHQQAQLDKSKSKKGKPTNIVISKNPPASADRLDKQSSSVSLSTNNQPTLVTSTFRQSPCPVLLKPSDVPQLRASTPSARSSQQQFSAKKSSGSAKSLTKQNGNNLNESGQKQHNSSKKLAGFIILTDQQINRTPKWENMQTQKNLWNKGQRKDLKFTEEFSSRKVEHNHKENQQTGIATTNTAATKNSSIVQNKMQRSSSIKSNSSNNKQSEPLGVINLFEIQNKPKEDQSAHVLTSKNLNIYPLPATLTPRQSSTRQYHPLHLPFFKNATPSCKSKSDYKTSAIFGKNQSSSKSSTKKNTPNNNTNNHSTHCGTFQTANTIQPATFSIIPIVQEIDLEAEHALKMNQQEYQNNNCLSHLHNSKNYPNFNTFSPSNLSNERMVTKQHHHRYQIQEGSEGFDEEFSPIAQRTKGEEDMSDISGLNPTNDYNQ